MYKKYIFYVKNKIFFFELYELHSKIEIFFLHFIEFIKI